MANFNGRALDRSQSKIKKKKSSKSRTHKYHQVSFLALISVAPLVALCSFSTFSSIFCFHVSMEGLRTPHFINSVHSHSRVSNLFPMHKSKHLKNKTPRANVNFSSIKFAAPMPDADRCWCNLVCVRWFRNDSGCCCDIINFKEIKYFIKIGKHKLKRNEKEEKNRTYSQIDWSIIYLFFASGVACV